MRRPMSQTAFTYNGSAQGFNGPVTVAVTVKDKKITAIKILSNSDTPSFFDRAKNGIIPAILKTQSTDVDVVSGATYSSNGIKNAGGALDSVRWRIFTPVCIPMARQKNAVSRLRGDELWFSLLHAGILALLLVRPGA